MSLRIATLLLAAALAAGCTRGTKRREAADAGTPENTAVSDASVPAAWLEGRLPADVSEGIPRPGGTLVVRLSAEPPSLDPITDSDQLGTWMLARKVYESLARIDGARAPDYPLAPSLAESWEVSPDGRTFTFHLRHDVRWHDGEPFDGRDVIATVTKIRDPKVRAMHLRSLLEDLESIELAKGDRFTVVATYKRPYFLAMRSLATLPILPKHVLDGAGDLLQSPVHRAPVGTGPFRFERWDVADKRVSFVRNETYWGRKAWLERVTYRFVADANVAFQLLQQGEFDLFTVVQPQAWVSELPRVETLVKGYHRIRFFDVNYSWVGWNNARPFFAEKRVRLAMTYAMDRAGMLQSFLSGTDRPTTCHFHPESSSCDPALTPRPYDPAEAAKLLEAAGWVDRDGDGWRERDGAPATFTFLTLATSVFFGKLTPYLQQELAKLGVRMEIRKVDWGLYLELLRKHDFDACGLMWGNTDVQQDPYTIWHSSQAAGGSNYVSYANPEADRLIEQARGELDDERRAAIYRALGRVLYDDNPYTWLYNRPTLDVVRKGVKGIRPQVPWYDLEDVWFAEGRR